MHLGFAPPPPAGAASVLQGGYVNLTGTLVKHNTAQHGGGLHADAKSLVSAVSGVWQHNVAQYEGGGFVFHGIGGRAATKPVAHVTWARLKVTNNRAVSGGGVFWRLALPYSPAATPLPSSACSSCVWSDNTGADVATSAVKVGLVPVNAPVASALVASGMRVQDYLANPAARPRVGLLDALDQATALDNATSCAVAITSTTDITATVEPLKVTAAAGVVSHGVLTFRANSATRLVVTTTCTLTSPLSGTAVGAVDVNMTITSCLPGWDLTSDRVCRRCLQGTYSPAGQLCMTCPPKGVCNTSLGSSGQEVSANVTLLCHAAIVARAFLFALRRILTLTIATTTATPAFRVTGSRWGRMAT